MSTSLQISLDKKRESQWIKVMAARPDLAKLGFTEAATKLMFECMDKIVPQEV